MPQIALILEDLLVDIVRLVLVQVHDLQAIGQNVSRTIPEASVRPFLAERHALMSMLRGPLLQPDEDDVDPIAVLAKHACRVQQLLKQLIVRRKFELDPNAEMVAPESHCVLYWLSREIRGDGERCGGRVSGGVRAIEHGERDPGEIRVRVARLVEHPNVADQTVAVTASLLQQYGVTPQRG